MPWGGGVGSRIQQIPAISRRCDVEHLESRLYFYLMDRITWMVKNPKRTLKIWRAKVLEGARPLQLLRARSMGHTSIFSQSK